MPNKHARGGRSSCTLRRCKQCWPAKSSPPVASLCHAFSRVVGQRPSAHPVPGLRARHSRRGSLPACAAGLRGEPHGRAHVLGALRASPITKAVPPTTINQVHQRHHPDLPLSRHITMRTEISTADQSSLVATSSHGSSSPRTPRSRDCAILRAPCLRCARDRERDRERRRDRVRQRQSKIERDSNRNRQH